MSFWNSFFGGNTGSNAAAGTYSKQKNAINRYNNVGDNYAQQMQNLSKFFAPYGQAGQQSLKMLMSGLGMGGKDGAARFTSAYQNLPGYQSGLKSGTDAATSAANAGGMLNSGAALKALQRFGSDYEDQRSGDYLSRLMGTSQMGMQARGQQVNTAAQGLTGRLNQRGTAFGGDMQAAGTIGQGAVADATAQQQGISNLMGLGGMLGGAFLGGPMGASLGTNLFGKGATTDRTSTYAPNPYNPWSR